MYLVPGIEIEEKRGTSQQPSPQDSTLDTPSYQPWKAYSSPYALLEAAGAQTTNRTLR
ncbi:MAG TPA: hypothetical protein VES73_03115 [Lamprocystis sp. (in: g-proteobacteria)]|nr:hypothetical protein [Lamprocystis sp. (in: g-proteobacteria)]